MVEVSAEKNSTLIFPVPVELLRFAQATADLAHQQLREGESSSGGASSGQFPAPGAG
jgi:hypothetical protein